jgi:ABC-2 type transport system permease protein
MSDASLRRVQLRAFLALCWRDLWVTVRHEPIGFLAQSLLQPIFFLFVFGRVLPEIGAARGAYGTQLMPGVMALTLVLTALQNTALPLVIEFSFTKEIEDRLLAPVSTAAVAIQKVAIAALRGILAAALIIPLAELILPGGVDLSSVCWAPLIAVLVVGSLVGACVGLVLGTAVPPNKISVMFAIILTPLIFTGATFYPWSSLARLRWFQVVTLFNPLTYVSEGTRASLTSGNHLATWAIALGLLMGLVIFGALGIRGFVRRAVD